MTDTKRQELRKWAAGLMEYHIYRGPIFEGDITIYPCIVSYQNKCAYFQDSTRGERIWWQPDTDLNQTFMVVERMKELGYYINHVNGLTHHSVYFLKYKETSMSPSMGHFERAGETARDSSLALAILLAAKATGVK
jgi:hypothetical protein